MEDFSKVFTIEVYTSKGWEVVSTHNGLNEAINRFRQECLKSTDPVRLTTPTDTTIYD